MPVPYPVSAPGEYLTNNRAELPVEGLVHTASTHHSCEGLHKDQISTTRIQRDSVLRKKISSPINSTEKSSVSSGLPCAGLNTLRVYTCQNCKVGDIKTR